MGMIAKTRQAIIAPISTDPKLPFSCWIATLKVLNLRRSKVR